MQPDSDQFTVPVAFDKTLVGDIDGERWALWTNGWAGVARRNAVATPSYVLPSEKDSPAGIIRHARAAVTQIVQRADILSFAGEPCKRCDDARFMRCEKCDSSGEDWNYCSRCNDSHLCKCPRCGGERETSCDVCSSADRPIVRILSGHYDVGLVRIVARALPSEDAIELGEMYQNSQHQNSNGWCLVLRAGDVVGVVMASRVSQDDDPRYPVFSTPVQEVR